MRLFVSVLLVAFACACTRHTEPAKPPAAKTAAGPKLKGVPRLLHDLKGARPQPYDPGLDALLRCAAAGQTIACLPKAAAAQRGLEIKALSFAAGMDTRSGTMWIKNGLMDVGNPLIPDSEKCFRVLATRARKLLRNDRCVFAWPKLAKSPGRRMMPVPEKYDAALTTMAKRAISGPVQQELLALIHARPPSKTMYVWGRVVCDEGDGRLSIMVTRTDGVWSHMLEPDLIPEGPGAAQPNDPCAATE